MFEQRFGDAKADNVVPTEVSVGRFKVEKVIRGWGKGR